MSDTSIITPETWDAMNKEWGQYTSATQEPQSPFSFDNLIEEAFLETLLDGYDCLHQDLEFNFLRLARTVDWEKLAGELMSKYDTEK